MKTKKIIYLWSTLLAGMISFLWMWLGYDIIFKGTVLLLLWMIYLDGTYKSKNMTVNQKKDHVIIDKKNQDLTVTTSSKNKHGKTANL